MKKLALLLVVLAACHTTPAVPVTETPDAQVDDAAPRATCASWCLHALALDCPAAKPTPKGASCVAVCDNVQDSGVVQWNLTCRSTAKSCAAADDCEAARLTLP